MRPCVLGVLSTPVSGRHAVVNVLGPTALYRLLLLATNADIACRRRVDTYQTDRAAAHSKLPPRNGTNSPNGPVILHVVTGRSISHGGSSNPHPFPPAVHGDGSSPRGCWRQVGSADSIRTRMDAYGGTRSGLLCSRCMLIKSTTIVVLSFITCCLACRPPVGSGSDGQSIIFHVTYDRVAYSLLVRLIGRVLAGAVLTGILYYARRSRTDGRKPASNMLLQVTST